jgi:hypothetical protein
MMSTKAFWQSSVGVVLKEAGCKEVVVADLELGRLAQTDRQVPG